MTRNKKIVNGLLIITVLFACSLFCPGCGWGKGKGGPSLLTPTLLKKNSINEEELKKKLRDIYPEPPPDKQSRYQFFVTPDDPAVAALAGQVDGVQAAYQKAVKWIWVSDQTLNGETEKWLLPHEFLSNTPGYPRNPVPGSVVSDCEEQANTLVSLLRAEGVKQRDVRVVLGKIKVGDTEGGHAWVELWRNGEWLPLEATSGPYWDDDKGILVTRGGTPFNYYANHDYPEVVKVWAYYNDFFYLDPRTGLGNAPDSWYP
jgi:transglutaminase-like putative cysteine protease